MVTILPQNCARSPSDVTLNEGCACRNELWRVPHMGRDIRSTNIETFFSFSGEEEEPLMYHKEQWCDSRSPTV